MEDERVGIHPEHTPEEVAAFMAARERGFWDPDTHLNTDWAREYVLPEVALVERAAKKGCSLIRIQLTLDVILDEGQLVQDLSDVGTAIDNSLANVRPRMKAEVVRLLQEKHAEAVADGRRYRELKAAIAAMESRLVDEENRYVDSVASSSYDFAAGIAMLAELEGLATNYGHMEDEAPALAYCRAMLERYRPEGA